MGVGCGMHYVISHGPVGVGGMRYALSLATKGGGCIVISHGPVGVGGMRYALSLATGLRGDALSLVTGLWG